MKAIILAAGRGSRMGTLTEDQPKCMTRLHGKTLIQWQLDALRGVGIEEIAVVRGYLAHTFRLAVRYFENPRWHETNMVMSLVAAGEWLSTDTCIVSYSDIVYARDTVLALVQAPGDIVITYDPAWLKLWQARFAHPLSDAETFRMDEGGMLLEIGNRAKHVQDIQGQYMGLLKFTPRGWGEVMGFINAQSAERRDRMDMTTLLRGLVLQGARIHAVACKGPWYEVDSENDLNLYQTMQPVAARQELNGLSVFPVPETGGRNSGNRS